MIYSKIFRFEIRCKFQNCKNRNGHKSFRVKPVVTDDTN